MKSTRSPFYQLSLEQRRRLLADAGFVRDQYKIWSHPDGRSLGEGVAAALTDASLLRYLRIDPPVVLKTVSKKNRGRTKKPAK